MESAVESVETALAALDAGDRAFFGGQRKAGIRHRRDAIRATPPTPDGGAVDAMARIRLLRTGTNWSPLWLAPRINRDLDLCWDGASWKSPLCELAAVDYDVMSPPGLANKVRGLAAAERLGDPVASASRRAFATGDAGPVRALPTTDGLGAAIRDGLVADPGPTAIGFGVIASQATGIGLGVHVFDPDVDRNNLRLGVDGWFAQRGYGGALVLTTPGRHGFYLAASGSREPYYDPSLGDYALVDGLRVAPGLIARQDSLVLQIGPVARWDADPGQSMVSGHGIWAAGIARVGTRPRWRFAGSFEQAIPPLAEAAHTDAMVSASVLQPIAGIELAGRLRGEAATPTGPYKRLPTVGGSDVLRGAPYGLLRGIWTGGADLEARVPISGGFLVAAFADGAWVQGSGPHGGGGLGMRFRTSPDPAATLRLDVGFTDVGWGVIAAWGEVM